MKTNGDSFFAEPVDPHHGARASALEVICRHLICIAEGPTLEERGMRDSRLWCVRTDLINEATPWEIGHLLGRTRQAVHQLAESFRATTADDAMNAAPANSPAAEINRLHKEVKRAATASRQALDAELAAARHAGQLLLAEKKRVCHSMGPGGSLSHWRG